MLYLILTFCTFVKGNTGHVENTNLYFGFFMKAPEVQFMNEYTVHIQDNHGQSD